MNIAQAKPKFYSIPGLRQWNNIFSIHPRFARGWMSGILVLFDLFSLVLAFLMAVWTRDLIDHGIIVHVYYSLIPVVLLFPLVFWWRGLYPSIGLGPVEELRRLLITNSLMFLAIAAFTFMAKMPQTFSRLTFGSTWILSLFFLPFGRALARYICTRLKLWGEPVVLVGPVEKVTELLHTLKTHPKLGLNPVAVIDPDARSRSSTIENIPVYPYGSIDGVYPLPHLHTALVFYQNLADIDRYRDAYKDVFERVVFTDGREHDFRFSGVTIRQYGDRIGLEVTHSLLDPMAQFEKRVMDIVISITALAALSPFLLFMILLIKLDSPGSPFYVQRRYGKSGKIFPVLKFRTMHANADQVLKQHLEHDPDLAREWASYQKLQNDPRITRVGKFLRLFSLDELPQLWNVLIGQMSLVGPRPIMVNQRELYGPRFAQYIRVTPGMTGKWQISGRNQTTFSRRVELDEQYVMDWSVWLDLYILIRTVWVVIRREGAC